MHKKGFTRRDFLVYSGSTSTCLILGYKNSNANEIENLLDPGNPLMIPTNFEPTAYFTMEPSGNIKFKGFRQPAFNGMRSFTSVRNT